MIRREVPVQTQDSVNRCYFSYTWVVSASMTGIKLTENNIELAEVYFTLLVEVL
jgi:hypothetical protein